MSHRNHRTSFTSDTDSENDFDMDNDTLDDSHNQQFAFDEDQPPYSPSSPFAAYNNDDDAAQGGGIVYRDGRRSRNIGSVAGDDDDDYTMSTSVGMMSPSTPITAAAALASRAVPQMHSKDIKELLQPVLDFYMTRKNYECMPRSGKVIVFDVDIAVREAFHIAAQNDISFATLWDSQEQALVGMLTVTDLIDILLHYHSQTALIKEFITTNTVREWRHRQAGRRNRPKQLVSVTPEDSLLTSLKSLHENRIHRLPVISRGSLLQIITHSHLLAYMVYNISLDLPIFRCSLEELRIGTFDKIVTATPDKTVHEVLNLFKQHHISAVPIVDFDGCIIDVFSRYDIVYLIRAGDESEPDTESYSLDYPISEAIKMKPKIPVFTCMKSESFSKVLRHLAGTRVHRLVCVDEASRVIGIVSISDIFSWLIANLSL